MPGGGLLIFHCAHACPQAPQGLSGNVVRYSLIAELKMPI